MLLGAHLGHWYVQLAFAAPAVAVIGFMTKDSLLRRLEKRRRARTPGQDTPAGHPQ